MYLWSGRLSENIVDFLFPSRCIGCGKWGNLLCAHCINRLPRITVPVCTKCGRPESSGPFCPNCWGWDSQIDGIRSPFRFDGTIRQAIYELKYHNIRAISIQVASLLHQYLIQNPLPVDVLVPVPLHRQRFKYRGYNQSELIAKKLGDFSNIHVVIDCLRRCRNSLPQARTESVNERRANVQNAFMCCNRRLAGKHVLLIDDVCTSGVTLEACATALKLADASTVWGLTLAREI